MGKNEGIGAGAWRAGGSAAGVGEELPLGVGGGIEGGPAERCKSGLKYGIIGSLVES